MAPRRYTNLSAQTKATPHHSHYGGRVEKYTTYGKSTQRGLKNGSLGALKAIAALYGLELTNVIRFWTSITEGSRRRVLEYAEASAASDDAKIVESALDSMVKSNAASTEDDALDDLLSAERKYRSSAPSRDHPVLRVAPKETQCQKSQKRRPATKNTPDKNNVVLANSERAGNELRSDSLPAAKWKYRGTAPSRQPNEYYNGGSKDGLFGRGRSKVPKGLGRRAAESDGEDEDGDINDWSGSDDDDENSEDDSDSDSERSRSRSEMRFRSWMRSHCRKINDARTPWPLADTRSEGDSAPSPQTFKGDQKVEEEGEMVEHGVLNQRPLRPPGKDDVGATEVGQEMADMGNVEIEEAWDGDTDELMNAIGRTGALQIQTAQEEELFANPWI